MERRYVGVKEIADYLGVKVSTIYDWVYRRIIPFRKAGRLLRFDIPEIDEWTLLNRTRERD